MARISGSESIKVNKVLGFEMLLKVLCFQSHLVALNFEPKLGATICGHGVYSIYCEVVHLKYKLYLNVFLYEDSSLRALKVRF